jgi:hypothetical protein
MANQTNNPFDNSVNQPQNTDQSQTNNVQSTSQVQAPQQVQPQIAQPLTIDQILHFEPTSSPTQIADTEATRQNFIKQFGFDANVSLAQEQELKRIQESERIRKQAEQDQNVKSFVQNQTNARLTIDDLDNLNNISSGLSSFSGLKNASMNDIQMRTLKMNAEKYGGIYAQRYNELTQNPSIARNVINLANQNPLDQIKPISNPQDNSTITPVNNSGNKYINAVKSGSASLIQTGALAFDALGQGIYKGIDKLTGNDVANQAPYEPNRVYQALQNLKDQKYGQSDQLTTLMLGADQASKDAEKNGDSPLLASIGYLAKNGSFGDAGELIAQSLPSLGLGFGAGGLAEKVGANLLGRYAGTTVAQRVAIGRLGTAQTNALGFIPKAIQGATIGGVSDFAGSLAPEFESQRQQGYDNSIALNRALTKSFAQAGVSSIGGSLLPFKFGGDVGTYIGQTSLQGLTGYGSGYAGAKSVGEEYSSTDGAVNLLLGAITAIPEAIAVGGGEIRRSQIQERIDDAISDRATSQVEAQKAQDNLKSMYFGAGIKDLIDRVRSSKTNERTPDTMTDFINHLQDNDLNSQTDVYIDADKFNQLANDHELDLQSLFQSTPELQKEYQRANDIDGVMRIPMHEVLTTMSKISNEEYVKAFADSLRHDPEALTAGEAREQLSRSEADIANEVSQVKESFNNERKRLDDENYVTDSINNELKNLEYGFNSNFNNNAKTLVGAFYKQLADKTGVTQKELFEKMPLRFASDEVEANQKLGQLPESGLSGNENLALNQEDKVQLRKEFINRDSHLAPDENSGTSLNNIDSVYSEISDRNFTKNYGDGFSYDAKAVKKLRDIKKNPEKEVTIYRAVPNDENIKSLRYGDWITLTKEYADEHGKARFNGDYKIIEQKAKPSDIYSDGNSIHELGYSPKDSNTRTALNELNPKINELNEKLSDGDIKSGLTRSDVLGKKNNLKNNPAIARDFLNYKGEDTSPVITNTDHDPRINDLRDQILKYNDSSSVKNDSNLVNEIFDKTKLADAREAVEQGKPLSQGKLNRYESFNTDRRFNLIKSLLDDVFNSQDGSKINHDRTKSDLIDRAKSYGDQYDNYIDLMLKDLGLDYYNQSDSDGIRGQIVFRRDKNGAVIILGKNANFSTFAHELGHNFLEMTARFALRADAPDQLKTDIETVMKWAKVGKTLEDWNNLTPEQRTEMHEKFAESFEQYMFEGKAPSNELRKVFSSFRVFMTTVYANIQKFLGLRTRADLNPEIRDVMDRMLASQEAIEQVQRQRNLEFALTEEQATKMGISPKDYLIMKDENQEATEQAINDLEQKTMKDLARFRTIRAGHLKTFSLQQKKVRQQVREQVAEEVAQEPVYQAIAYLRQPTEEPQRIKRDPNKVDPEFDTLLDAIAKMGGIDSDEIAKTWGTDKPESYKVSVGRTKKVARKNGLSIETVAERLAEDGYLSTDEHGKFDTNELEDKFSDSLSGSKFYSNKADFDKIQYFDSMGMAIKDIDMEQLPESGKLDLDWLKERYKNNPDVLEQIATTGKYGLAQKNGMDPDMIAEFMGYDSAEKMIADIVQSPSAKDEIERRSNELINAQHADLFDENSVQQAIDEAVHNDVRATILSRELATISKLQGNQSELNNITKNIAQNIINNSQVKDIRPHLFSAGELKNSKAYNNAIKNGETLEAVRAKRQQLINFHATKQAYQAQEFISKLQNLGSKINGNDKTLAKNRDFNLVAIARYLLDLYDISGNPSNYQEHIDNLKKYDPLASAQVADLIYTTDENGSTVNRVPVDSLNNLTFDQVQELDTMIRQIWHLSKANNKIMVGEKSIAFKEAKDNLITAMSKKKARSRKDKILGYAPRSVRDFNPQRALQSLKRAEQFFTWLDDGKANGYFHQYIFNPMQDKLAEYRTEQRKVYKSLLDIFQEFTPYKGKIDASELGGLKSVFDSKQELLHAILHTGNESNKRRLILGFGWGEKLEGGAVDYSKWNSFFNKMIDDGVITKQDMDSIQKIWDTFDQYKEMAQQTHKRLNGLYFKELPKDKISTKWGEYEGGYIPADYDKLASVDAEQRGKIDPSTQDNLFMAGATTGANFTKSRAENFNGDQLTLDMSSLPSHIDRELRYIFLEEQLKQASKIFRNKEVLNKIESVSPYAIDGIISDWLTAVSNQSVNRRGEFSQFDRVVDNLKRNSGIVLMAGNIKNAVEVWTSVPQLMAVVPAKELASASAKFFTNAFSRQSMIQDIRELSPFMNVRFEEGTNQIRNEIESIVVNKNKFLKGSDFIKQHAYIVQTVFEKPFTAIGWIGAYNDAMGKGMSQQEAVYHADGVVRQYMNDMTPEGISKIERGTPLMRAMLMFYGWFNMLQNTWFTRNKLISERTDIGALNKMGRYAGLYMSMIALPAMLSKALTLSFSGELGNTDSEDKENADLVNIVVKSQAEMLMGMLPFLRDVLNPIYRTSTETTAFSDRYQVSPIISMGENLVKSGERTIKKINDNDVSNSAYAKNLLQSVTFATGIPFTLAQRPVSYGVGVASGEIQPKDNADIARGLVNGK